MTVGRLLDETSSVELSLWLVYLQADAELREERAERARRDQALVGDL